MKKYWKWVKYPFVLLAELIKQGMVIIGEKRKTFLAACGLLWLTLLLLNSFILPKIPMVWYPFVSANVGFWVAILNAKFLLKK